MAISKIGSKALVDCSVAAVDIEDNSITSAKLAGSIANAKLANSSITVNGTSVSLGASGSIPAVSWQSVITADGSTATSAVAGNGYFIDTTSNAHTINLPGSPSAGDTIAIKDYAGTFGSNNLTIGRNGNNIQGVANDSLISTDRASIILVYSDATKGWLYTVESNVADLKLNPFIEATGGTVSTSGDYKIHTFTGDGCFVVSNAGNPGGSDTVDYLVVAGGGGGGAGNTSSSQVAGGGGGAGGFRLSNSTCMPAPLTSPLATPTGITVSATTYPITVGGGGPGGPAAVPANGTNGSNSVFSTITSAGGGGGGSRDISPRPGDSGFAGGSGGGAALFCSSSTGGAGNTPPVSPPQGNPGGDTANGGPGGQGGGGGAGAAGSDGSGQISGGGGIGSYVLATGFAGCNGTPGPVCGAKYFAGGGAAGVRGCASPNAGRPGGAGGGADSGAWQSHGSPGTINTGGGASGASSTGGPSGPDQRTGGNGGKGIVIIRYKYQ